MNVFYFGQIQNQIEMKRLNLTKVVLVLTLLVTYQNLFAQGADSTSSSENKQMKMNVPQLLFRGGVVPDDSRNRSWFISPVFDLFQYNTVEGFVFNPRVSMTQQLKDGKFYAIKPNLRYGFGSERLYGKVAAIYSYNPTRFGSLMLNWGKFIQQFDQQSTLTPFANSYSTLLAKENFLKIYESQFLEVGHHFSPVRNVLLSNSFHWASRGSLSNLEQFNDEQDEYTSNTPLNRELDNTTFDRHQVFYQATEIRWQPDLNYEYQRGKFIPTSKYPAFILKYKSAHSDFLGSDLSYENISFGVEGMVQVGSLGNGNFSFEGGDFISKDSLSFVDFTHFQGNRTAYTTYKQGTFQLLDYYSLSTTGSYFRGHYTHTFEAIKNKFIPVVEGGYLHASGSNYIELGIGMQRASKPFRISFYNSWLDGKHDRAEIRFGFVMSEL